MVHYQLGDPEVECSLKNQCSVTAAGQQLDPLTSKSELNAHFMDHSLLTYPAFKPHIPLLIFAHLERSFLPLALVRVAANTPSEFITDIIPLIFLLFFIPQTPTWKKIPCPSCFHFPHSINVSILISHYSSTVHDSSTQPVNWQIWGWGACWPLCGMCLPEHCLFWTPLPEFWHIPPQAFLFPLTPSLLKPVYMSCPQMSTSLPFYHWPLLSPTLISHPNLMTDCTPRS